LWVSGENTLIAEEGLELVVVFRGKMGEISEKAGTY
jgi:hypothetical protein